MATKKSGNKKKVSKKSNSGKEIFEVDTPGKEKIVEKIIHEDIEKARPEQLKKEKKQLRSILITLGIIVLFIALVILFFGSLNKFTYEGVKFDIQKQGDLVLYHTTLPFIYNGTQATYNFYLRNDPRKVEVPFYGNLSLRANAVLNMSGDFFCSGDSTIAVANLANQLGVVGIRVVKDENATCDPFGRYTYINILEGNESKIAQTGPSCYNLYVNNCEILPVTEKLMVKEFSDANEILSSQ